MDSSPPKGASADSDPAAGAAPEEHGGRLRSNALSLAGGVVIGVGSSGPTASIALTLAAFVAAVSFAGPLVILVCALPMLGIALAYRRLNMWSVNCGGTYMWAGRAISPYFGFMVGWIIVLAYLTGVVAATLLIGPYVLQLFSNSYQHSQAAEALIGSLITFLIAVVAYIGIRATARAQWALLVVEYLAVLILSILALRAVFGGSVHASAFDWNWFSWKTLGGVSGFVSGSLLAVFMFSGWDTAILVNEETQNSRVNPGNAVVISVICLALLDAFLIFANQGAVQPSALQDHSANALAYLGQVLGGSTLAKFLILAVLLSVVAGTLAGIVATARVIFAMADDDVLPRFLARVHSAHKTPAIATAVVAALMIAGNCLYALGSASVQASFGNVISSSGLLFGLLYAATGISVAVYYRRLAVTRVRYFVELELVPLASAAFLLYIVWRAIPGLGGWTGTNMRYLYVMLAIGVVIMIVGRVRNDSTYFHLTPEAYDPAAETSRMGMAGGAVDDGH